MGASALQMGSRMAVDKVALYAWTINGCCYLEPFFLSRNRVMYGRCTPARQLVVIVRSVPTRSGA
jgi:hypothetical protein